MAPSTLDSSSDCRSLIIVRSITIEPYVETGVLISESLKWCVDAHTFVTMDDVRGSCHGHACLSLLNPFDTCHAPYILIRK